MVDVAAAATTCAFDDASHVITATLDAAAPHTFDRSGTSIRLDGSACEDATVDSTETVDITAAEGGTLTFDLSGGAFAPGATDEGDGSSEIEFVVGLGAGPSTTGIHVGVHGTDGADHIIAGIRDLNAFDGNAIDLNADEAVMDADISAMNGTFQDVTIDGLGGDDDLLGYFSKDGCALPAFMPINIDAGAGDDTLGWWGHGGSLDGGDGRDLLDESIVGDDLQILLIEDRIVASGFEITASNLEDVIGGPGRDWIVAGSGGATIQGGDGDDDLAGTDAADVIDGGEGRDHVVGLGGDDELTGGGHRLDQVSFGDSLGPVTVDLQSGTATGEGSDLVDGFGSVVGTSFADTMLGTRGNEVFFGGEGADELHGRGGADEIYGNGGGDRLFGERGDDYLVGGWSDDALDGGRSFDDCDGGHGKADTAVRCEEKLNLPRQAFNASRF
jgi:Ca2+-binding RTX toxin-like protein